jgi:hypothetical protein
MTRHRFQNPFHDVWVTETLSSKDYVARFSPAIVDNAEALFSPANVIVKGRQGSGKSMLLGLLDTENRMEFERKSAWPGDTSDKAPFISAYVNLVRENAALAGLRAKESETGDHSEIAALLFGDYLDTLLCVEILASLSKIFGYQSTENSVLRGVEVRLDAGTLQSFCELLKANDAYDNFMSLDAVTLEDFSLGIRTRLKHLKAFFNFSESRLPELLTSSRRAYGEVPRAFAKAACESGLVPKNTLFFLCIDQFEEIYELEKQSGYGAIYRQIINAGLARRERSVSYRIGTRHYAWDDFSGVYGSKAPIELNRDYSEIDIDRILQRHENRADWLFPRLANDVLRRLFQNAGFDVKNSETRLLFKMFGRKMEPKNRAKFYVGARSAPLWEDLTASPEVKAHLQDLWSSGEPLAAWLGAAWLRQAKQVKERTGQNIDVVRSMPWLTKGYWIKERNEAALLQIAGFRQQSLIWSGSETVLDIAGTNVLALMTICGTVWSVWLRHEGDKSVDESSIPKFSERDQSLGIQEASDLWLRKIKTGNDDGDERWNLIQNIAKSLRSSLLADLSLSNPGATGFSIVKTEISNNAIPMIQRIKFARDHGDLLEFDHTTKLANRIPRAKFYLHPLLCPIFRLPHIRTKEPKYLSLGALAKMLGYETRESVSDNEEQLQLFGDPS